MSDENVPVGSPAGAGVFDADPPAGARSSATNPLALERRAYTPQRGTAVLDWVAFVLAFLVAPLGVVVAVVALVLGHRSNGWGSGIAKAAIGIGVIVSVALGGGYALLANVQAKQAAHDRVIASSAKWCSQLRSTPGVLQSPTYDWPDEQDTVGDSIVAMQKYADAWKALHAVAPAGIARGTASIEDAANGIIRRVTTSRSLDDGGNQTIMANAVADSGVAAWVSQYCG